MHCLLDSCNWKNCLIARHKNKEEGTGGTVDWVFMICILINQGQGIITKEYQKRYKNSVSV